MHAVVTLLGIEFYYPKINLSLQHLKIFLLHGINHSLTVFKDFEYVF